MGVIYEVPFFSGKLQNPAVVGDWSVCMIGN